MIVPIANPELEGRIRRRLDSLTKPQGSLGRLEEIALQVGLIQNAAMPAADSKAMLIFCADHGIVEEGVSPYPAEVTRQMWANFQAGGAAINVLCRNFGIEPVIVDMGVGSPTRNFAREPAMSRDEAARAIEIGRERASVADILGAGEMGIGNTTAAAALLAAFTGLDPAETAGRGTGLDDAGLARKVQVIRAALALHRPNPEDGLGVLAALGGREIAAIAGLILGAAERKARCGGAGRFHRLLGGAGRASDSAGSARLCFLRALLGRKGPSANVGSSWRATFARSRNAPG